MARILVVDDEQSIREMLEIYLQREGYDVTCAADGQAALSCFSETPFDVVVADIKMPVMDGLSLLKKVRERSPETIFIMITAFASFETAKQSMDEEAYDYITKPFDVEDIKQKIESALAHRMTSASMKPTPEVGAVSDSLFGMIGRSKAMYRVFDLIPRAASSKSNVLITGESGTGKELVARAIHANSDQSDRPFVTINCGGIPETLLESELFGYKKGAFTGAAKDKKGFLEKAHGGTLFLDEVGELPLALQVKLLRVVQEKTFVPVGDTQEMTVDIRLISATNKDLQRQVAEGTFREDLFYRLNVIHIYIPPLRERTEDIPLLVRHFSREYAAKMGKEPGKISDFVMTCLKNYHFPGNVRELENIVEKGVALSKTNILLPETLQDRDAETSACVIPPEGVLLDDIMAESEKRYIQEALRMSGGSVKDAAKLLGITFRSMRYRLKKLGIDKHEV